MTPKDPEPKLAASVEWCPIEVWVGWDPPQAMGIGITCLDADCLGRSSLVFTLLGFAITPTIEP